MSNPVVHAIADIHGFLPDIPDCDLLLISGDFLPDFHQMSFARYGTHYGNQDTGEQRQRHWLDTNGRDWLEALAARGILVVATWGNHDYLGEHPFLVPDDLPWTLLIDKETTVFGLRIYGTPWVPNLPRWAFYADERALKLRAEAIPEGLDVLMSHGPPYGYTDFVVPKFGAMHVGDVPLRDELDRIDPKTLVCGHIHEGRGVAWRNDTAIINVAHVDENYDLNKLRGSVDISRYLYGR